MARERKGTQGVNVQPAVYPEAAAPMGLVGAAVKEERPDPVWEKGRELEGEARRALERMAAHWANHPGGVSVWSLCRAVDALRALKS